MRVVSGTCRGKRLYAPPGVSTRPTSDRVKESLFSILSSRIDLADIDILDICAGTGSLGIEALSRGGGGCCFIEWDKSVIPVLSKNLLVTGLHVKAEIMIMDALQALQKLAGRNQNFDLVLFDPPYDSELYQNVLEVLASTEIMHTASILVAECQVRKPLRESYSRLKKIDRREYGETALELFALEDE